MMTEAIGGGVNFAALSTKLETPGELYRQQLLLITVLWHLFYCLDYNSKFKFVKSILEGCIIVMLNLMKTMQKHIEKK